MGFLADALDRAIEDDLAHQTGQGIGELAAIGPGERRLRLTRMRREWGFWTAERFDDGKIVWFWTWGGPADDEQDWMG